MEDKLVNKRVEKDGRKGIICNYVEVTVSWDGGGCSKEKLSKLKFLDIEEEKLKKDDHKK